MVIVRPPMRCRPVGDRYSIGRPPPWRPVAGGFHDVSTAGPRRARRERDDRRLAGGRGDRGGRRPDRVGRARRRAADGHRVDPRDPRPRRRVAAAGLRRDAHPHALPGGARTTARSRGRSRSSARSSARPRRCARLLLSGATTARDTGSRLDVALAIRSATCATASSPGRACWWSGRRSRPPPGTTGSWVARPTRPTPSSRASARRRRPASTRSSSWRRAAATRRPPTRARSSTTPRRWPRPPPRRTAWGCRSWPTR